MYQPIELNFARIRDVRVSTRVRSMAFDTSGQFLAVAHWSGESGGVSLLSWDDGVFTEVFEAPMGLSLDWSQGGFIALCTTHRGGRVIVRHDPSGPSGAKICGEPSRFDEPIDSLSCSDDGRFVALHSPSGATIWALEHLDEPVLSFDGATASAFAAGSSIWVANGTMLWLVDVESGRYIRELTADLGSPITSVTPDPNVSQYLMVYCEGSVALLDPSTGKLVSGSWFQGNYDVGPYFLDPTGTLAIGSPGGSVIGISLPEQRAFYGPESKQAANLCGASRARRAAIAFDDERVQLIDWDWPVTLPE